MPDCCVSIRTSPFPLASRVLQNEDPWNQIERWSAVGFRSLGSLSIPQPASTPVIQLRNGHAERKQGVWIQVYLVHTVQNTPRSKVFCTHSPLTNSRLGEERPFAESPELPFVMLWLRCWLLLPSCSWAAMDSHQASKVPPRRCDRTMYMVGEPSACPPQYLSLGASRNLALPGRMRVCMTQRQLPINTCIRTLSNPHQSVLPTVRPSLGRPACAVYPLAASSMCHPSQVFNTEPEPTSAASCHLCLNTHRFH